MLYYVLVYECVLVQLLRSGVLSFNRLSNNLVRLFIYGGSVVFSRFLVICASLSTDSIILRLLIYYVLLL